MVSGKEFRAHIPRPMPGAPAPNHCRLVPAFTIQSMQKNTCILPPPRCNVFKQKPFKPTNFRTNYLRGDLPIALDANRNLSWKVKDIGKLDYHHYLPMFFDGIREIKKPFSEIALKGVQDMLAHGAKKVFPVIPQLIIPIKEALNTKNKQTMCCTLKILQSLVKSGDMVGEALVPYYRQILPTLNIYKEINVNCGDRIDYSQMRGENLADLINETLQVFEKYGGEDAFINIKYIIPTYESAMMN